MLIIGSVIDILMELVLVQAKHQPFDDDGTIPSAQPSQLRARVHLAGVARLRLGHHPEG
jgi:hypothetical protein